MIESALGEGTTVRVRLPYAAVDDKGTRLAPSEARIIFPSRARLKAPPFTVCKARHPSIAG